MDISKSPDKAITLRPATAEDAPTILAITRAAFEEFRGHLDPPSGALTETLEGLTESTFQAEHGAALAFVAGQPAGSLRWEIQPQRTSLYVERLAVLPAYRRQGIASALMQWAEDHARTLALPAMQLGVRLQAPQNIRFYQHLGYQIIKYAQHEGYAQPTFVWMRKDLMPS